MIVEGAIQARYQAIAPVVDERVRRLVLAAEASAAGRGGQAAVARATGASRGTIRRGIRELGQPAVGAAKGRIRHPGGGRKRTVEHDPSLREDLDRLVEPTSRGDPESPLRWTCKSVRQLAAALKRQGHQVSHRMVAELLHDMGYSLQANRKTLAGTEHPDRNAQFEHLDRAVQLQLSLGEPVISVDTKKKELVGAFKNGGRELRPKGAPEQVLVHDFLIPDLGLSPYGVYDIAQNEAWVSVGTDHDTAAFAVESIRRWWRGMGQALYPSATLLLITADAGDSNGFPRFIACGSWSCRNWRMRRFLKSTCQPRSTRDQQVEVVRSTACSPRSVRTGPGQSSAGEPRGGALLLDRGDHVPDGAAGSDSTGHPPIPGQADRFAPHELRSHLFAVETLSMVNGIIRGGTPQLRCSIDQIISWQSPKGNRIVVQPGVSDGMRLWWKGSKASAT